jgi:hypothetical protein
MVAEHLRAEQHLPPAGILPDEIFEGRRPFRPHRASGFADNL